MILDLFIYIIQFYINQNTFLPGFIIRKDLAEKLAEEFGCSKKDATAYVQFVFDTVADTLKNDGTVDVFGFGKFSISERAARTGINPATKEKIEIAASKSVKFKASKSLKDAVK